MPKQDKPRDGTKHRTIYELLTRPGGATRDEINKATGWNAWGYWNDTKELAGRYGGTPRCDGKGGTRRFWIE